MKVVAVTACSSGIAHTYMAAEALEVVAKRNGIDISVETQGAMGIENELAPEVKLVFFFADSKPQFNFIYIPSEFL